MTLAEALIETLMLRSTWKPEGWIERTREEFAECTIWVWQAEPEHVWIYVETPDGFISSARAKWAVVQSFVSEKGSGQ